jgi:hypothetical protein
MFLAMLAMVDPQTMQNFWSALITLLIALAAALQQWNASKGKARGDAAKLASDQAAQAALQAKQAVDQHNQDVTQKIDTISKQTNDINTKLQDTIAQQSKDALADKDRQIAALSKPPQGG